MAMEYPQVIKHPAIVKTFVGADKGHSHNGHCLDYAFTFSIALTDWLKFGVLSNLALPDDPIVT